MTAECAIYEPGEMPIAYMALLALLLSGCICLCGLVCLTRVKNDDHLFQDDNGRLPFPFCCFKAQRHDQSIRAQQARERAKQKYNKEVQKDKRVERKANKQAR